MQVPKRGCVTNCRPLTSSGSRLRIRILADLSPLSEKPWLPEKKQKTLERPKRLIPYIGSTLDHQNRPFQFISGLSSLRRAGVCLSWIWVRDLIHPRMVGRSCSIPLRPNNWRVTPRWCKLTTYSKTFVFFYFYSPSYDNFSSLASSEFKWFLSSVAYLEPVWSWFTAPFQTFCTHFQLTLGQICILERPVTKVIWIVKHKKKRFLKPRNVLVSPEVHSSRSRVSSSVSQWKRINSDYYRLLLWGGCFLITLLIKGAS